MLSRLYASRTELTLEDHFAQALRYMRQAELLDEIERFNGKKKLRTVSTQPKPARSAQEIDDLVQLIRNLTNAVSDREGKMRREQASSAVASACT